MFPSGQASVTVVLSKYANMCVTTKAPITADKRLLHCTVCMTVGQAGTLSLLFAAQKAASHAPYLKLEGTAWHTRVQPL